MNNPKLIENLRVIPNFPKPGIMFQDISTLFDKAECLKIMCDETVDLYKDKGITKIVGIESRGFLLASAVAKELNAGVVMCRKPGKLPCIHTGSISENDVVLLHDDLLATGGSMKAAYDLVKMFHPKKIYINFIIELTIEGLHGRDVFDKDVEITTLLKI